jgi:hypothetical protein
MGLAYQPPGVYVSEEVTPSINPLLAAPANVCIIGPAQGYVTQTDVITLVNEDNIPLPNLPAGATLVDPVISVTNVESVDAVYQEDTDYVVNYNTTSVDEVQNLLLTATGGTYTLTWEDQTTADIDFDATNTEVQTALEALLNVEPGDITVSDITGGFALTWGGQYANANVSSIEADDGSLTGPSAGINIEVVTEGGVKGTIRRNASGAIDQGTTVRVVYRFVPADYFRATRLDSPAAVESRYGSSFNTDGTINSSTSFAAQIAFDNGAHDVVVAPLFRLTSDVDPNSDRRPPSNSEIQSSTTWSQTLHALRDIEDINVLVPAVGQSFPGLSDSEQEAILAAVQNHIAFMATEQQYLVAIFGEDSTTSSANATDAALRAHAQTLASSGASTAEQLVLLNSSKLGRINPVTSQLFYVGGQYAAAGVAGLLAGRDVAQSLTRQSLVGFVSVADVPVRSKSDKNTDASLGLTVLEQRGQVVQIRHAITLDTSATQRRELSVVRSKHRMIESVRDTLDTEIVGQVIADAQAPQVVAAAVGAVLEALKTQGDLVDYTGIQSRTLTLDPTTVEVRFSYKPSFPLNYINIVFSIDLTTDNGVAVTTA